MDQAYENEAKSKTDLDQSKRELIRIQVGRDNGIILQTTNPFNARTFTESHKYKFVALKHLLLVLLILWSIVIDYDAF